MRSEPDRFAHMIVPLTRFFYAMLGVSLLSVLVGSPGSALFFLIVGAAAQVLRAAIQESIWQRRLEFPQTAGSLQRRRGEPQRSR
jgi:hypothetical protein